MTRKIFFTTLSLLFLSLISFGQTQSIKGKITDIGGQPVFQATLVLEGQGIGAQTNENGEFEIKSVPLGAFVLIARATGFVTYKEEIILSLGMLICPSYYQMNRMS